MAGMNARKRALQDAEGVNTRSEQLHTRWKPAAGRSSRSKKGHEGVGADDRQWRDRDGGRRAIGSTLAVPQASLGVVEGPGKPDMPSAAVVSCARVEETVGSPTTVAPLQEEALARFMKKLRGTVAELARGMAGTAFQGVVSVLRSNRGCA